MKQIEILAPAGSKETFIAAVSAGADAVYCGLQNFNARIRAQNFTNSELFSCISYARSKNIKVYAALNTLVQENEIEKAIKQINFLSQIKVDAVIVQDFGIANIIQNYFPNLKLHASTQTAIHNSLGVITAQKFGFKRVVLSRELSMSEIQEISKKTNAELEIFVHGALCFSISGLCLISSFIGGYSGNRGQCAQTCRRRWKIKDKDENFYEGFYTSPKDLDLSSFIKELKSSGVTSLKIEGRMKNIQYVYNTVKAYKLLLNSNDDNDIKEAEQLLKRDFARPKTTFNFIQKSTDIFTPQFHKQIGLFLGKVISVNKNIIVLRTKEILNYKDEIKITDSLKNISYKARILNIIKTMENYEIQIDSFNIKPKMDVFKLCDGKISESIKNIIDTTIMEKQYFEIKEKTIAAITFNRNKNLKSTEKLFLRIDNLNWIKLAESKPASLILILNKETIKNKAIFYKFDYFELPPHISEFDLPVFQKIVQEIEENQSPKTFFINNLSHFYFFKSNKSSLCAGSFLYILNSFSAKSLFNKGIQNFVFSIEDDFKNIKSFSEKGIADKGIFYVFGYPILAVSLMTMHKDLQENKQILLSSAKDSLKCIIKNEQSYIIPQFPVTLFNKISIIKKLKISKFMIDLSFVEPNKSYLNLLFDAYKRQGFLQNGIEFNFKRGLK